MVVVEVEVGAAAEVEEGAGAEAGQTVEEEGIPNLSITARMNR